MTALGDDILLGRRCGTVCTERVAAELLAEEELNKAKRNKAAKKKEKKAKKKKNVEPHVAQYADDKEDLVVMKPEVRLCAYQPNNHLRPLQMCCCKQFYINTCTVLWSLSFQRRDTSAKESIVNRMRKRRLLQNRGLVHRKMRTKQTCRTC